MHDGDQLSIFKCVCACVVNVRVSWSYGFLGLKASIPLKI